MSPLIVVIVDENEGPVRSSHVDSVVDDVAEMRVIRNAGSDSVAVAEFGHISYSPKDISK